MGRLSIALKAAINELRERTEQQAKFIDGQARMIEELYQRIEKLEQRKPKPKADQ